MRPFQRLPTLYRQWAGTVGASAGIAGVIIVIILVLLRGCDGTRLPGSENTTLTGATATRVMRQSTPAAKPSPTTAAGPGGGGPATPPPPPPTPHGRPTPPPPTLAPPLLGHIDLDPMALDCGRVTDITITNTGAGPFTFAITTTGDADLIRGGDGTLAPGEVTDARVKNRNGEPGTAQIAARDADNSPITLAVQC